MMGVPQEHALPAAPFAPGKAWLGLVIGLLAVLALRAAAGATLYGLTPTLLLREVLIAAGCYLLLTVPWMRGAVRRPPHRLGRELMLVWTAAAALDCCLNLKVIGAPLAAALGLSGLALATSGVIAMTLHLYWSPSDLDVNAPPSSPRDRQLIPVLPLRIALSLMAATTGVALPQLLLQHQQHEARRLRREGAWRAELRRIASLHPARNAETTPSTRADGRPGDAPRLQSQRGVSPPLLQQDLRVASLPPLGLWGVVALLAALGSVIGWLLGAAIHRAIRRATKEIGQAPRGPTAPTASMRRLRLYELNALNVALKGLGRRMAETQAAHFVAIERIIEANQRRTQFLANMSHDLKSPLNSIIGFSELLERGLEGQLNPDQQQTVELIHRAAKDLLEVINEVLDAAKVELHRMELHRVEVLPARLLSDTAARARERCGERGHPVELSLEAGLPPLLVDELRFADALFYLIRHGAARTSEPILIELRRAKGRAGEDQALRLELRYRSLDLPVGTADQLLEPGPRHPRERGLGLGTWLAKRYLELHGAHLSARIEAEQVSFVAYFPRHTQRAPSHLREVEV